MTSRRSVFCAGMRFSAALVVVGMLSSTVGIGQVSSELAADRVAVVPFDNISGRTEDDWLGAGIAETVAAGLNSGLVGLRSVTRASGAGQQLEVRWVVAGSYQRLGGELRITARVVDVLTGLVSGAVTVDGELDRFFVLQDQLVGELLPVLARAVPGVSGSAQVIRPPSAPSPGQAMRGRAGGPATRSRPVRRPTAPGLPETEFTERAAPVSGVIYGPAPPVAPAVINRDAEGRATVRATRLTEEFNLDGSLDEQLFQVVPPLTDFIQQAPNEGEPASEKTEVWVAFDDRNFYLAGRVWNAAPESEWVANEMRRDSFNILQNDNIRVVLDTFYDRRNAVGFIINPIGGFADITITNEGNPSFDWNPIWNMRTGRFEGGWIFEMLIPFRSLRYRPGSDQVWGFQVGRGMAARNERAFLTPLPISAGRAAVFRVSEAASLVGLEVPDGSKNVELKPYTIGGVSTNLKASPPTRNVGSGDFGVDVKYGITQNLTADFTYNTDFAQVEVDEQQVNLTRFSLFFPEKREFFLEGAQVFNFARGAAVGGFGGALRFTGGGGFSGGGNAPTLFYSRQIGLKRGTIVPILGGGRVTGKVGAFDVGLINIQTDDEAVGSLKPTNFTVGRVRRDILRRSTVGALFTNRSTSLVGDGASQTYGADATFSFYENISLVTYLAKTEVPGLEDENASYQGRFEYGADRYGFRAEHLVVEDNFIPEVGFLRRDNFRRTYTRARFSPRPRSLESVRQFFFEGALDYIEAADTGIVQTRQSQLGFSTQLENTDSVRFNVAENYEFLTRPFRPGPGVTLPVGGYDFRDVEASYTSGPQRRLTGTFTARAGGYFNGTIRSVGFRRARFPLTEQFSVEPSVSLNWIDTPLGEFQTNLVVTRVNYTFTPRMFFSGLVQYNSASHTLSNNLRLRWEYIPGSELFVVYTEDRETDPLMPDRNTELRNRGFVVKFNRLLRF